MKDFVNYCAINIFSKHTCIVPLKEKKSITINNTFQEVLKEFGLTPNKIWSEKGSEFYDRSLKSWLQNNHIQMFSTQ